MEKAAVPPTAMCDVSGCWVILGPSGVRVSEPGTYVVVPKGAWHTARPHAATTMLFVTPGEGTLNAESPPDS